MSPYLCDDLQVFDVGPLCGQQFLGYEVGLVCGKLLDTNRKMCPSIHISTETIVGFSIMGRAKCHF